MCRLELTIWSWAAYLTHCAYLVGVGCVNDFQIGSDRQRMASIGPGVNRAVGCISRD